jgi:hypothetical protein
MILSKTYEISPLIILYVVLSVFTVNAQSVAELEEKHGFQDIKLDSGISAYSSLVYKKSINYEKSEEPIHIYDRDRGAYQRIGDVPIRQLEVKVFLGKIIEIKIITEKNTDIMKALKLLYGEPSFSVRTNAWEWRSEGVLLSLKPVGKKKLEIIYASRKLNQYIKIDKEESIEDISTDF